MTLPTDVDKYFATQHGRLIGMAEEAAHIIDALLAPAPNDAARADARSKARGMARKLRAAHRDHYLWHEAQDAENKAKRLRADAYLSRQLVVSTNPGGEVDGVA